MGAVGPYGGDEVFRISGETIPARHDGQLTFRPIEYT
jgi:hypothetical protein